MEENTRRQITWLVIAGIVASLVIISSYRHGAMRRARQTIAEGLPAQRVKVVESLVGRHKLSEALQDEPRWVQDKAVSALGYIGSSEAMLQLVEVIPLLDKPVADRANAYLVMMGRQAIGPLVEKLQEKDDLIRGAAVGPLVKIGVPVIPSVTTLVGAYDDYVRDSVVGVFGGIGAPAAPALIELAQRTEPHGEESSAEFLRGKDTVHRALAAMKVAAIEPVIGELLTYEKPEVRAEAGEILGQIMDQTSTFVRGVQTVIPIPVPDAQRAVGPLVERLNTDSSWRVRRQAALALGRLYESGRQPLIMNALLAARSDPNPGAKAAAVEALGLIGDPAVAPAVVDTLMTNRRGAEREIAICLQRLGQPAIAALTPALKAPSIQVRRIATEVVAQIGTSGALMPLAERLSDSDVSIRRMAAEALTPIATADVALQLAAALEDPDWKVYHAAEQALAGIGPRAVPALLKRLPSGDARTNYMAEQALAAIGAPAIPQLVSALHSQSVPVREWVAVALGDMGPVAVDPVTEVLSDPAASVEAKAAAVRALGHTGVATAMAPLLEAAAAPHEQLRLAALRAISDIRSPEGTPVLVESLGDPSWAVRDLAMGKLKHWRLGEVEDALSEVLDQGDANAKRRAAIVLAYYHSPAAAGLLKETIAARAQEVAVAPRDLEQILSAAITDSREASHIRGQAIEGLGYTGSSQSVSVLKELLTPESPYASPAARSVALIGTRVPEASGEAAELLLRKFKETASEKLRLDVAVGLSMMKEQPVPALVDGLETYPESLRPWITGILGAIGEPANEHVMERRSKAKKPEEQMTEQERAEREEQKAWCAAALILIGNTEALQLLKFLLEEERPDPERVAKAREFLDRIVAARERSPGYT